MRRAPGLLALLTALVLGLATVAAGHARGHAQHAGAIVICTGEGVVTVLVDAEGQPVERRVLCPDCVLSLLACAGVPPGALPATLPRLAPLPLRPAAQVATGRPLGIQEARAPPSPA
ncbi:hypothetical protein DLJ49_01625 [Rhodovulum sp. 12E13]|uniref:hypothetical protein n=1 Tax=Rhodovulum sp. 12E13 TaxID=2203891 RepID=UPI000E190365|nr:hypothetical protein [Rhodovulum sp. 12E13]RDC75471.1 hypothetical protein DLJ49_01625 [Rhodovulum sp. 12E13]